MTAGIVVGLLLLLPVGAEATVFYVGGNTQGANWWAGSWANLQAALDAAAGSGDVVKVSGNLTRNQGDGSAALAMSNAFVTLSGGWDADFTAQSWCSAKGVAAESLLYSVLNAHADAGHPCGSLAITAAGVNVSGFSIRNGYLTPADGVQTSAGVVVSGGGGVTLSHLVFTGHSMCQAWGANGGVVLNLNSPSNRVEYVSITGNTIGDSTIFGMVKLSPNALGTTMLANLVISNNAASAANWTGSGGSAVGIAGANIPGMRCTLFGSLIACNGGKHTVLYLEGPTFFTYDKMVVVNSTVANNAGNVHEESYSYCNFYNTILADNIAAWDSTGVVGGDYTGMRFEHCLVAGEPSYISRTVGGYDAYPCSGNSAAGTFFTNNAGCGFFDASGACVQANTGGSGFTGQSRGDYTLATSSAGFGRGLANYDSRGFAYVEINGTAGYQAGEDVMVDRMDACSYVNSAADYYYPVDVNGNRWIMRRTYTSDAKLVGTLSMGALSTYVPPQGTLAVFR
jgi:hypothetical protein